MKGIKNSLKKLSRISLRESIRESNYEDVNDMLETKRNFYRESISSIATTTYRNIEYPEDAVHPRILEAIEDLEIREEDIFLVSYPASNGHLLEDMIRLLVNKDQKNKCKILEKCDKMESIPVGRLEVANLYGHLRWLKSLKSPRILASNLPYDSLPHQLHVSPAKIIYQARNPKDHLVSYYYHHRLKGVQISLDDFVDLYLHGYLLYGNYFDHVASFWQLAKIYPSNVFFVTYEELKIIPFQMAKMIVNFLNLNLTDEEIGETLSQKHGLADAKDSNQNTTTENEPGRKTFSKINKFQGVLGDWVNYLSTEQAHQMDNMIKIKFESQQLSLPVDVTTAIKRIEKYGRLIGRGVGPKTEKLNGNEMYSTWTRANTTFSKKPVFTKDEAAFIRKKDKVVILEEQDSSSSGGKTTACGCWLNRMLVAAFCCCSTKRGYASF